MPFALNRTTITTALKASDIQVTFASSATLKAGDLAYIDREAMTLVAQVQPAIPTIWWVQRGVSGTPATAHAINNQVYTGPPGWFYVTNPSGSSSVAGEAVLPYINILSGDMFQLSTGGSWQQVGEGGVPQVASAASGVQGNYTTSGAITPVNGRVSLASASALAMTLAPPTQADDGTVMTIVGGGGGAHTVTVAAGFNGAGSAYDVATFAATGGTLMVQVSNGAWLVLSAVGVTIA